LANTGVEGNARKKLVADDEEVSYLSARVVVAHRKSHHQASDVDESDEP
jgi:hypothetical protein